MEKKRLAITIRHVAGRPTTTNHCRDTTVTAQSHLLPLFKPDTCENMYNFHLSRVWYFFGMGGPNDFLPGDASERRRQHSSTGRFFNVCYSNSLHLQVNTRKVNKHAIPNLCATVQRKCEDNIPPQTTVDSVQHQTGYKSSTGTSPIY